MEGLGGIRRGDGRRPGGLGEEIGGIRRRGGKIGETWGQRYC